MVNVVLMAHFFAKESVGIVLPLLVVCDLVVYPLYRRFASWNAVWPLLLPSLPGLLIGYLLLARMDGPATKQAIGWIILAMLVFQLLRARYPAWLSSLPQSPWLGLNFGLFIGTATSIANAAGPVYSIWALVRRLPKEDFLGIGARLFLLLNLIKLPFNASLGILNSRTLLLDAALLPAALAGIFLGRPLVLRIPQASFDRILYLCCGAGALWLILT